VDIPNKIIAIGDAFQSGKQRIGRDRLPANTVAFLDDPGSLCLAIRDLHAYAIQSAPVKPPHTIVFRVVESAERDAVNHRIKTELGIANFLQHSEMFCPRLGQWHLLDSEHFSHAHNRHSHGGEERRHGHLPIVVADFEQIPSLIDPRNIEEFSTRGDSPRIIYRAQRVNEIFIVVVELCRRRGMIFKTLYKQKK
jgi:hypothetical protein